MEYAVVVGFIECESEHDEHNIKCLDRLPKDDKEDQFPWLNRTIFAVPGPYPIGRYRSSIFHLGFSVKSSWNDWDEWIRKFEVLLSQFYFNDAYIHFLGDYDVELKWLKSTSNKTWERNITYNTIGSLPRDVWEKLRQTKNQTTIFDKSSRYVSVFECDDLS